MVPWFMYYKVDWTILYDLTYGLDSSKDCGPDLLKGLRCPCIMHGDAGQHKALSEIF